MSASFMEYPKIGIELSVLSEFDIFFSTCSKLFVLAGFLKICLDISSFALTSSSDSAEVVSLRALALESSLSLSRFAYEEVSESLIACVGAFESGSSLSVLTIEDVNNSLVLFCASSSECFLSSSEVTLAESDHTISVLEVSVFGLNLTECLLSSSEVVLFQEKNTEVELSAVAIVFLNSLVVESLFCLGIFYERSRTEESLFIENVAVLFNELEELFLGVVLV